MPRFQTLTLACLLPLVAVLVSACTKAPPPAVQRPVPGVRVAAATSEEITDVDEFVGRTEPYQTVEVRSRVSGFLLKAEFEDGQMVTEGQVLFRIEPDSYEAAHQQDLAKVTVWESKNELARATLSRKKPLFETNIIAKEEYDEAVAAVKVSEAEVAAAKADAARSALDVKYTVVTAPIPGRVDRQLVVPGNLVTQGTITGGTLLTRIVNNTPMYVYFDIDEKSYLKYREVYGASANADVKAIRELKIPCLAKMANEPDFSHTGIIEFVESKIDTGTGSINVRGTFPNTDLKLLGGAFARVQVPVSQPYKAVLIPERAIASDQGTKYVLVVTADNVAERRNVELGRPRERLRVILKGVQAGDRVITDGLLRARPGEKVNILNDDAADAPAKTPAPAAATPKPAHQGTP